MAQMLGGRSLGSLNLNALIEETFDVQLGQNIYHLRKPTEEMVVKIEETVRDIEREGVTLQQALPVTAEVVTMILNYNTDGRTVPEEMVKTMPIDVRLVLIREYVNVIKALSSNPS